MRPVPGRILLLLAAAVCLAAPSASALSLEKAGGEDICAAVQDAIAGGMKTRAVVRTAIALGHPACVVMNCALLADEECDEVEVVRGARDASVPSEVVARCCVDACCDAARVADILAETGPRLCYFEPPGEATGQSLDLEELELRDPLPPEKPRGDVSPHTFVR